MHPTPTAPSDIADIRSHTEAARPRTFGGTALGKIDRIPAHNSALLDEIDRLNRQIEALENRLVWQSAENRRLQTACRSARSAIRAAQNLPISQIAPRHLQTHLQASLLPGLRALELSLNTETFPTTELSLTTETFVAFDR